MNSTHKAALAILCSAVLGTACGDDENNGTTNNGQTNNGVVNNGTVNNGTTNNGTTNNGTTNNGTTNNGTTNNGTTNNGTTNNGTTNNGTTNNGTTNNGTTNNGTVAAVEVVDCATVTADVTVSMFDFGYMPADATVTAGQVVEWTNDGAVPHTVTSGLSGDANPGTDFDSGLVQPGDSYCLRFDGIAGYNYFCTVHPTLMTGSVDVQ